MSDIPAFDYKKTLSLVQGSLFSHPATAKSLREEDPGWQKTLVTLTAPVIIVAAVLGALLAWIFGSVSMFRMAGAGAGMFVLMLIWFFVAVFIFAFVAAFVAGQFGGTNNFNRGFALVSLVAVVGYTGSVLGTLPWIGWLLSLVIGIYSLVLFYRDVPTFLDVPDDKRVVHLIVTIVAVIVVNVVLSLVLRPAMPTPRLGTYGAVSSSSETAKVPDIFGLGTAQVAAAMEDKFDAPDDGEISDAQMRSFVDFAQKASARQKEIAANLEKLSKQDSGSVGDVYAGFKNVADLQTTEIKVVKDGGGNWAEYQWVKQQLAVAKNQPDLNDATRHNHELLEKYQGQLPDLLISSFGT